LMAGWIATIAPPQTMSMNSSTLDIPDLPKQDSPLRGMGQRQN
jgi:hypothetical protein